MENPQARLRASQPPVDRQRDDQPDKPFNSTSVAQDQGETEALADTAQPLSPQPSATSKRKRSPRDSQRTTTTAAKRKPTATFRRMWEVNQQLYAEELKRLEAEADRINHLLADHAQRKAQLQEASARSAQASAQAATPPTATPPAATPATAEPTKARCQSLRMNSAPQLRLDDDEVNSLQVQAERIHELLAELEAAITEGNSLVEQPNELVEQPDKLVEQPVDRADDRDITAAQPWSEFQPTPYPPAATSSPQLQPTPSEALRHLNGRDRVRRPEPPPQLDLSISEELWQAPPPSVRSTVRTDSQRDRLRKRRTARWRRFLLPPKAPIDRLGDALLWVVVAIVLRVVSRFVLTAFPALTPVVALLMLVPAAIAVYLAICVPQAGFLSIYRLFLVMLGLLIGGKF